MKLVSHCVHIVCFKGLFLLALFLKEKEKQQGKISLQQDFREQDFQWPNPLWSLCWFSSPLTKPCLGPKNQLSFIFFRLLFLPSLTFLIFPSWFLWTFLKVGQIYDDKLMQLWCTTDKHPSIIANMSFCIPPKYIANGLSRKEAYSPYITAFLVPLQNNKHPQFKFGLVYFFSLIARWNSYVTV